MARRDKASRLGVVTTSVSREDVIESCADCQHWFEFEDKIGGCGECRARFPDVQSSVITSRGRVCGYPVTLASTPKCPHFQAR